MTTTREVAERITRGFGFDKDGFVTCDPAALIDEIEAALQARDERAAKIAESFYSGYGSTVPIKIADTIRKGL